MSREEAVVHPPGRRKGGKGKEEEKILERKGGIVFVCVCVLKVNLSIQS